MSSQSPTPIEIVASLRGYRFNYSCEDDLQKALASVLTRCSIPFQREYVLSPKDRLDFLVGTTAIEVKIQGSLVEVVRQVQRYLQSPKIESVIVVTTRNTHRRMPETMNGKTIHVLYLPPL